MLYLALAAAVANGPAVSVDAPDHADDDDGHAHIVLSCERPSLVSCECWSWKMRCALRVC
jgi:hypothetical protein